MEYDDGYNLKCQSNYKGKQQVIDNSLDLDEIEILKEIKLLLEPFKKVTEEISGNFHTGIFCYKVIC